MKYPEIFIPEEELARFLEDLTIDVVNETGTDLICRCPFHANLDYPAFNISKSPPYLFHCWNPVCAEKGNIFYLVEKIKGFTPLQCVALFREYKTGRPGPREIKVSPTVAREYEIIPDSYLGNYSYSPYDLGYMKNRGFTQSTLKYFEVGRFANYITIPVRDEHGFLVGVSKRDISRKPLTKYRDSDLPKRFVLFNLNHAIGCDTVIVVEGPMDSMKVHQAGYPNVVSIMSGSLTKYQEQLLRRNFRSIIIFTDSDESGRKLGEDIALRCKALKLYWAQYPKNKKDPGELTEAEIQKAIENKQPNMLIKIRKVIGGI